MLLCLALAAVCAGLWYSQRSTGLLLAAAAFALACPVIGFIERQIVTPAEEVEAAVGRLADAVRDGDPEAAAGFIAIQAAGLQTAVRTVAAPALQPIPSRKR